MAPPRVPTVEPIQSRDRPFKPLYVFEAFMRSWLVEAPRLVARLFPSFNRLISLAFMYMMLQVLALLWAFLLNAASSVTLDVSGLVARHAFDFRIESFDAVGAFASFLSTYFTFRVFARFGLAIGVIAWESLDDFPDARRVVTSAAAAWPFFISIVFIPQFFLATLLFATPYGCARYEPELAAAAAAEAGGVPVAGPQPFSWDWASLWDESDGSNGSAAQSGVVEQFQRFTCTRTPLLYLSRGYHKPRRTLMLVLVVGLVQFFQILLHRYPRWRADLYGSAWATRLSLHFALLGCGGLTGAWLVRWAGMHWGFDFLNVGLLADHREFGLFLIVAWTTWVLAVGLVLCRHAKSPAPDVHTLQEFFQNLKTSFVVSCGFFFARACFHPHMGFLDAQQELTLLSIILPIVYVLLYALVHAALRLTTGLIMAGGPVAAIVATALAARSSFGGPGTVVIVWLHVYGKLISVFGEGERLKAGRRRSSGSSGSGGGSGGGNSSGGGGRSRAGSRHAGNGGGVVGGGGGGREQRLLEASAEAVHGSITVAVNGGAAGTCGGVAGSDGDQDGVMSAAVREEVAELLRNYPSGGKIFTAGGLAVRPPPGRPQRQQAGNGRGTGSGRADPEPLRLSLDSLNTYGGHPIGTARPVARAATDTKVAAVPRVGMAAEPLETNSTKMTESLELPATVAGFGTSQPGGSSGAAGDVAGHCQNGATGLSQLETVGVATPPEGSRNGSKNGFEGSGTICGDGGSSGGGGNSGGSSNGCGGEMSGGRSSGARAASDKSLKRSGSRSGSNGSLKARNGGSSSLKARSGSSGSLKARSGSSGNVSASSAVCGGGGGSGSGDGSGGDGGNGGGSGGASNSASGTGGGGGNGGGGGGASSGANGHTAFSYGNTGEVSSPGQRGQILNSCAGEEDDDFDIGLAYASEDGGSYDDDIGEDGVAVSLEGFFFDPAAAFREGAGSIDSGYQEQDGRTDPEPGSGIITSTLGWLRRRLSTDDGSAAAAGAAAAALAMAAAAAVAGSGRTPGSNGGGGTGGGGDADRYAGNGGGGSGSGTFGTSAGSSGGRLGTPAARRLGSVTPPRQRSQISRRAGSLSPMMAAAGTSVGMRSPRSWRIYSSDFHGTSAGSSGGGGGGSHVDVAGSGSGGGSSAVRRDKIFARSRSMDDVFGDFEAWTASGQSHGLPRPPAIGSADRSTSSGSGSGGKHSWMLSMIETNSQFVYKGLLRVSLSVLIILSLFLAACQTLSHLQDARGFYPNLIRFDKTNSGQVIIDHARIARVTLETRTKAVTEGPRYATCGMRWSGLTLIDYALLAELAYFDLSNPRVDVDAMMKSFFPRRKGEPRFILSVPPTADGGRARHAQFIEAYAPELNLSVVAIRGTDFGRISDFVEDVNLWVEPVVFMLLSTLFPTIRIWPDSTASTVIEWLQETLQLFGLQKQAQYYHPVVDHVRKIRQSRDVMLTGHSLGGGLARIVGALERAGSVSFSPPGIAQSYRKFRFGNMAVDRGYLHHTTVSVIPEHDFIPMIDTQVGLVQHIMCNASAKALQNSCHMLEGTICDLIRHCGDRRGRFTGCSFDYNLGHLAPVALQALQERFRWVLAFVALVAIIGALLILPELA